MIKSWKFNKFSISGNGLSLLSDIITKAAVSVSHIFVRPREGYVSR